MPSPALLFASPSRSRPPESVGAPTLPQPITSQETQGGLQRTPGLFTTNVYYSWPRWQRREGNLPPAESEAQGPGLMAGADAGNQTD